MNDKALGRLAVAQYMLVITYASYGKKMEYMIEAAKHYRDAEHKRKTIDKEVSKVIDWGNRMEATKIVSNFDPHVLSGGLCQYCGQTTAIPKRCTGCKVTFYCSKECQRADWKSGHKLNCQDITLAANQNVEGCLIM
jgi:hypothetical protein